MSMQPLHRILAAAIALAMCLAAPAQDGAATPTPFRDLDYREALAAAAQSEKPVLVYATAVWCGPCRIMEQSTWTDERVIERLRERMVAIKLDVDEAPERARELAVRAMPTMIVLIDGEEFDRKVGLQTAEQMIAWLDTVERGERGVDRLRERVRSGREDQAGRVDVEARYELAQELHRAGELDAATEEFVWLWRHMLEHKPGYYGVRLSFMLGDLEELVAEHRPAREAFGAERDAVEARLRAGEATMDDLVDWVALNGVLRDEVRTLAWFDRVKDDPEAEESIMRVSSDLERILESRGRWADLGSIYRDSARTAERRITLYESERNMLMGDTGGMLDAEALDRLRDDGIRRAIDDVARIHGACLAAGRDEEAASVAKILLDAFDTPAARLALVRWAVLTESTRPQHREWLHEIGDFEDAAEMRRAVEGAGASR